MFNNIDISDDVLLDKPKTNKCINKAKRSLRVLDTQKWHSALMRDGTHDTNGNKLRTYRLYKNDFRTEYYVNLNMSRDQRRILSKFRACNLPLAIETGRYTRPKTPVNDRLCKFCNCNAVEDETHFLVECAFYSDLRDDVFRKALTNNSNFNDLSFSNKLVYLMNDHKLQYNLATCLIQMIRRRKLN